MTVADATKTTSARHHAHQTLQAGNMGRAWGWDDPLVGLGVGQRTPISSMPAKMYVVTMVATTFPASGSRSHKTTGNADSQRMRQRVTWRDIEGGMGEWKRRWLSARNRLRSRKSCRAMMTTRRHEQLIQGAHKGSCKPDGKAHAG